MKKGNCSSQAYYLQQQNNDFLVCHGYVDGQGPIKGQRIFHAWCELGDVVFDNSNEHNFVGRKEHYYRIGNIKEEEIQRYTFKEVQHNILKYKHFGPWEVLYANQM